MPISTCLFDLDGTLYDRDKLIHDLATSQYRTFAGELEGISEEDFVARVVELDNHGYFPKEQLYARLAQQWSLREHLQAQLLAHFWDTYDSHCVLPADTAQTLADLSNAGMAMGIITNGQTHRQNRKIDALGLRDYFDVILISESEGVKKPDAEIFLRAVRRCRAAKNQTLFVGDHPAADVAGARNAGLQAVWKRVTYWEMERTDVRTIDNLAELLTFI